MAAFMGRLRRWGPWILASYDTLAWFGAAVLFLLLRFADQLVIPWADALVATAGMAAVYGLIAWVLGLSRGRARIATLEEMVLVGAAAGVAGLIGFLVNLPLIAVPRSMPVVTAIVFYLAAGFGRALWRRLKEREAERLRVEGSQRTLLVGAGDAAHDLIQSMLRDPQRRWQPVGMLDDDPHKRHLRIRGIPVAGRTDQIEAAVERLDAEAVILAIPSASSELVQSVSAQAHAAGVAVKVLPSTSELLTDHVGIRDLRDINLSDVLGRNQLDTDIGAIASYLTGRRVLVTGAGGSIGSELCRQISRFDPAELMMLDRDESALHAVQLSITGRALLDGGDVILCDIRDTDAVDAVFRERRPEVVFHAAALKHLPMLEQYPSEAVKTNVHGTRIVLEAARRADVDRFVNISTDKAANPTSVLGYSKRIAEQITASHAFEADAGTYLSVRFGNVLGSRGSVLAAFAGQIASGKPLTVTHPDVTRYFMTIEEACQLVVQAAAIGRGGEALVLEMGEPIRILDVARQLIRQSGRHIPIEYTGLRPGEKLHEELFGDGEPQSVRPRHHFVSHVPVPRMLDSVVDDLPLVGSTSEIIEALERSCLVLREGATSQL